MVSKFMREINSLLYEKIAGLPCSLRADATHLASNLSHLLQKRKESAVFMGACRP